MATYSKSKHHPKHTRYQTGLGPAMLQRSRIIFGGAILITILLFTGAVAAESKTRGLQQALAHPLETIGNQVSQSLKYMAEDSDNSDEANKTLTIIRESTASSKTTTTTTTVKESGKSGSQTKTTTTTTTPKTTTQPITTYPTTTQTFPSQEFQNYSQQNSDWYNQRVAEMNKAYEESKARNAQWAAEETAKAKAKQDAWAAEQQAEQEEWRKQHGF